MKHEAEMHPQHVPATYRALFLSDIHLGTRACQADALLEFLKYNDAETIYLVGDIIDFWKVRRGAVWLQSHNDVVQKLLRKVRKGTRLIFIPGNHDEALRLYCGSHFGGIEMHHDFVHETADGKRLLVMHGDEFDVIVRYARWLAILGDRAYEILLASNHPLNWIRRRFGFGYWSLSSFLKLRVKAAVSFIGEFEEALANEAHRREVDGVICGHIHHAADRMINGMRYINCGDWVESRTAIAEDHSGAFHLLRWEDAPAAMLADRGQQISPAMLADRGQQISPAMLADRGQQISPAMLADRGQQSSPAMLADRGQQIPPAVLADCGQHMAAPVPPPAPSQPALPPLTAELLLPAAPSARCDSHEAFPKELIPSAHLLPIDAHRMATEAIETKKGDILG